MSLIRRIFRRKPSTPADRYKGRPLLGLVECYALQAIDALPAAKWNTLCAMAPSLQKTWNTTAATWPAVLEESLHLPQRAADDVRQMWTEYQQQVPSPDPLQFAMEYADRLCIDVERAS